jgi:hypothetical protein
MALLFSFHERSDGCGEQKTVSRLKKRAKIIVSHLSPADEEVTQTAESRIPEIQHCAILCLHKIMTPQERLPGETRHFMSETVIVLSLLASDKYMR